MRKNIPAPGNNNFLGLKHIDHLNPVRMVILGAVDFGAKSENADLEPLDLLQVMDVEMETAKVMRILDNREFTVPTYFLYEYNAWLEWLSKMNTLKDEEAKRLEETNKGKINLLSSILQNQGIRIVTEEEAKALGLKEK